MSKDFRELRRQRQEQAPVQQGITPVIPEDVYTVAPLDRETVSPLHSETVSQPHGKTPTEDDQVIKTSFYPKQDQLDKLDDLASEYNRRYRRQRKRIDRQDIMRYLIDQCSRESIDDLRI